MVTVSISCNTTQRYALEISQS